MCAYVYTHAHRHAEMEGATKSVSKIQLELSVWLISQDESTPRKWLFNRGQASPEVPRAMEKRQGQHLLQTSQPMWTWGLLSFSLGSQGS